MRSCPNENTVLTDCLRARHVRLNGHLRGTRYRSLVTSTVIVALLFGMLTTIGITSTPVIDLSTNNIYVMAYTQASDGPTYTLHALDLGSLIDKIPPEVVAATHPLTDGSSYSFNATYQRQRPSLLEANGNVYAGFGSFCDYSAGATRGWVLGWSATTLAPLVNSELLDTQASDADSYFLSSIWMSGYGLAADDSGNVVFVTANSDFSGTTYDGITNVQESVVKLSSDLSTVVDLFTPDDQASLDETDTDFGSGGVMILPDQPGTIPHLAVAAGKNGSMFFMNEDDLGGYSPTTNNVLGTYQIGGCWCGESYFVDPSDGLGRVVSSGLETAEVWKVVTSPSVRLAAVSRAPLSTGQRKGFFTSISSNGTSNPIIWALARPTSRTNPIPTLYALNPEAGGSIMSTLFIGLAGSWPNWGSGFNQVPMIANGKVYVASNKQLRIFGLKSGK